jgi:hypothetical protein
MCPTYLGQQALAPDVPDFDVAIVGLLDGMVP